MEIKIASERENPLLGRKEMWVVVRAKETPRRAELKTRLAAELGVDEKLIIIDKIRTIAGTSDSEVYVKVYKDEEYLNKIEPKHMIERNKVVEENAENEGQAESQA
ncbi:MAG: small subunit ribosomal protein S24e [Candidatus Diapherotrites archaeon]|nr:small subunit ribosomal protein S24e [Candidatus Diapherotrites archaeon]MDN5366675.1 small subunit ribosomal protein S24e [Candidatus Diapherotrites archaeon]